LHDVKRHVWKVSRTTLFIDTPWNFNLRILSAARTPRVRRQRSQPQDASLPSDPSLPSDLSEWGSQDVAIAAFLMLLWKEMYPVQDMDYVDGGERREWDAWGRPKNGFVDLGCVSWAVSCSALVITDKPPGERSSRSYPPVRGARKSQ